MCFFLDYYLFKQVVPHQIYLVYCLNHFYLRDSNLSEFDNPRFIISSHSRQYMSVIFIEQEASLIFLVFILLTFFQS